MSIRDRAQKIIHQEITALQSLVFGDEFENAISQLISLNGKLVTTGIGKAGYIARKSASTFCTTGTPAVFLHPGDASHGDLGLLTKTDFLLAFSNSGKNREVLETAHFARTLNIGKIISITSSKESPLGEMSDIVLPLGKLQEACPLGFTPTSSTTAMLAISDALAIVLMEERGFSKEDFAIRHHGGYLGVKSRG